MLFRLPFMFRLAALWNEIPNSLIDLDLFYKMQLKGRFWEHFKHDFESKQVMYFAMSVFQMHHFLFCSFHFFTFLCYSLVVPNIVVINNHHSLIITKYKGH